MLTQSFAEALAEAERIITGAPHVQTEADLAEGYDYLAGISENGSRNGLSSRNSRVPSGLNG